MTNHIIQEILHCDQSNVLLARIIFSRRPILLNASSFLFTRESSYCFQRVLAIAILSVCPSVTRVDQSKTVQARITKSSPSAAWKTL